MFQTAAHILDEKQNDNPFDVELRKVFKVFDGETAVRGVDLEIRAGEFFSILGPSGCGKTTTLRLIGGFDTPEAGEVLIRGKSMTQVPPYQRPVNTVFQSYALFNHMTIAQNIAFGLKIKRLGKAEIEDRVTEALQLVKMESFAHRFPSQLSGGQQQRVALARALVNRPAVVLLDEPLGALDLKLRKQMQVELSSLHQDLGLTFVMVTHDQEEALSLSDRIAVMHEGRIEQVGSPTQIYERPRTPFVADFIGDTNLLQGKIEAAFPEALQVRTGSGLKLVVNTPEPWSHSGTQVVISVRPEKIHLSLYPPSDVANCFEGRLKNIMYMGTHVHYRVELPSGDNLTVRQPNTKGGLPDQDTPIYVHWSPTDCIALVAS
ncbi:MAG TPA: ABC transporter ATP-binding protein [Oscillatoriaceae cyanobacterium M33_DOE_052]|uniref:Spermidine/putrescine import ATP-binding protein PotA n=1 Tax=Planktothricoides sp. SpSt-374 TaxID=2282167 RepID=A0A7C3VIW4_9CYAN|nr:ABC transporter ATP-binding protein [Oscillatoriaceae cyanobacterium M33_DOE_052]